MSVVTLEKLWEKAEFKPNQKQEQAILHTDGPLFLAAGPGSGKTRVLLWRTVNLLVFHGIKPEEIFLSTFTEKAAYQLRDGLRSLLGLVTNETGVPYDISQMALGTVHSICQKLIMERKFDPEGKRGNIPVIQDALGQYFTVYRRKFWKELVSAGGFNDEEEAQRAINAYFGFDGPAGYSRHWAVTNCISIFNRLSEEDYEANVNDTSNGDLKKILKMYEKYKEMNAADRSVDFSLLQQAAFRKISKHEVSTGVFKHIIIDEYQDTNSIQEKIFFRLAAGHKNICVVGDDDQALYRFRGAAVENLVEFEDRCVKKLGVKPKRIDLDINYRSSAKIVDFYNDFIQRCDWKKDDGKSGAYRITGKNITPHSTNKSAAVVTTDKKSSDEVYEEIAEFVHRLRKSRKIEDYNQVAMLFPAMKSNSRVEGFREAFAKRGIQIYAPRAGRFLEVDESVRVFGIILKILGGPIFTGRRFTSRGMRDFQQWMGHCDTIADGLLRMDKQLAEFVKDRKDEIKTVLTDYEIMMAIVKKKKYDLNKPCSLELIREFSNDVSLSQKAKKNLTNRFFMRIVKTRLESSNSFTIKYIINRTTSLNWSVLDLFYQMNGFKYFRDLYKLAETGQDEGPICNLGLITQYLSKFNEQYSPVITGAFLSEDKFYNTFFNSYCYAIFRLGETEFEDVDDPFPKGRVPFLTIHQAKGLEFPVVILGAVFKDDKGIPQNEKIVRDLLKTEGEPLDRINEFDRMRMFYVALSRAQKLLILPRYTHSKAASEPFKGIFDEDKLIKLQDFDLSSLSVSATIESELRKMYSYTADYLNYQKCPRNYMIFRKYGFKPSRSQTMFFGSLVHQTIEDLHHHLISKRGKS